MEIKIERSKAKEKIVERRYFFLTQSSKLKILERIFPSLDETDYVEDLIEDGELPSLNKNVIELIKSKEYLSIPFSDDLKPVFIFKLKEQLYGVTNEYLQLQLNDRENNYIINGDIEEKGLCPCCLYYSIAHGEDGFYDICSICFWENGGSGPNDVTLQLAQNNFIRFGAMDKSSLGFVDPEGKIKYKKEHSAM